MSILRVSVKYSLVSLLTAYLDNFLIGRFFLTDLGVAASGLSLDSADLVEDSEILSTLGVLFWLGDTHQLL